MKNVLEQLKGMTRVVADTGDFESMRQYKPVDATTNPSLIYSAAKDEKYSHLMDEAIAWSVAQTSSKDQQIALCLDRLAVNFGKEILKIIPGRVSTEVDARLSFDTEATIKKARQLIQMYESEGIERERILIKIAASWEGIRAAEILEKEQIHTNLTLLFSKIQAIACAEAGVKLISPFVGRILDWYKHVKKLEVKNPAEDPGVVSVRDIYFYYKKFAYSTEIMGASFRNTDQIIELAGCDLLTISPSLLAELESDYRIIETKLDASSAQKIALEPIYPDEKQFRWELNEDAMATEKLAEGIRRFTADLILLEDVVKERMLSKN